MQLLKLNGTNIHAVSSVYSVVFSSLKNAASISQGLRKRLQQTVAN